MQAFISYSFLDKNIMNKLKNILQTDGIVCYVAEHDENYGGSLPEKLSVNIDNSDILIVILTHNSSSSSTVGQEIGYAKKAGKRIIPLIESGMSLPVMLQGMEYVTFTSSTLDAACKKISRFVFARFSTEIFNKKSSDENIGDTVVVDNDDAMIYEFDLEDGDALVGQISSNRPVNIFIVNNRNRRLFEEEDEFSYEDGIERAKRYTINFYPPRPGTWNVIIQNEESTDAEVDINLTVEST